MQKYSLSGINVPPEEFLRPFFDLQERMCLRVFSDRPDSAFAGTKIDCYLEHFADVADTLKTHNDQGRGVFFTVNYGGHEDSDITRVNAQFCEMDDIPLEEQLARVQAFPLEPSLIVKTRKSLHCYCGRRCPARSRDCQPQQNLSGPGQRRRLQRERSGRVDRRRRRVGAFWLGRYFARGLFQREQFDPDHERGN